MSIIVNVFMLGFHILWSTVFYSLINVTTFTIRATVVTMHRFPLPVVEYVRIIMVKTTLLYTEPKGLLCLNLTVNMVPEPKQNHRCIMWAHFSSCCLVPCLSATDVPPCTGMEIVAHLRNYVFIVFHCSFIDINSFTSYTTMNNMLYSSLCSVS